VRGLVQTYLSQQLGYTPTLLEFNFSGRTWEDSSLGCPQPGQSYTEGQIAGYFWQFLMGDGIRYGLHSDLAGRQIVLCPASTEANLSYSGYTGAFFSLQHPNTWSARQAGPNQVDFNFQGQSSCVYPEMRVLVVANISDSATLLDAYYSSLGLPADRNTYIPTPLGLSTQHPSDCSGTPRQNQATAIIGSTNASYLILQSAPQGVFSIWAGPFEQMRTSFFPSQSPIGGSGANLNDAQTQPPTPTSPATLNAMAPPTPIGGPSTDTPTEVAALPTSAPTAPNPPLIVGESNLPATPLAHLFLGEVHIGSLANLPGRSTSKEAARREHLRVSQDGLQLAYIEGGSQLMTISMTAPLSPNRLAEDVFGDFPPAWGPEAPALAYVVQTESESETDLVLEIRTISPDGSRQSPGTFAYRRADCPAAESDYTVDELYWAETDAGGNRIILEWLPGNRFLYSPRCDGIGLAILEAANGQSTPLGENLRRPALSPDRTRLAALEGEQLIVIDLTSLEKQTITLGAAPDQLGWDTTSTQIFYSSVFPNDSLRYDDPAGEAQARQALGVFPFESRLNLIRIFQLDRLNGLEVQLWEGTGFAVGALRGAPDGKGLLFTLIPSDRGLLTNFINQTEARVLRNSRPETELYYLPSINSQQPAPGPARLLAYSSGPVFGALVFNPPAQ
jgi:hypothetical protein